jgi:hypothetical protein
LDFPRIKFSIADAKKQIDFFAEILRTIDYNNKDKVTLLEIFEDKIIELKRDVGTGRENKNADKILSWLNEQIMLLENTDPYSAYWNDKCKSLFEYIVIKYITKRGNRKFINIYHFLKNRSTNQQEIVFDFNSELYMKMITDRFQLKAWKKNNKPDNNNWSVQEKILSTIYSEWKASN